MSLLNARKENRTFVVRDTPVADAEAAGVLKDQWTSVIWPYLSRIGVVDEGGGNYIVAGDKWQILIEKIVPITKPKLLDSVSKWLSDVTSVSHSEGDGRVGTGDLAALVLDFWDRSPNKSDDKPNIRLAREVIHKMRLVQDQAYMVAYYVNSVVGNPLVSAGVRRAVYEVNDWRKLTKNDMERIIKEAARG